MVTTRPTKVLRTTYKGNTAAAQPATHIAVQHVVVRWRVPREQIVAEKLSYTNVTNRCK